jgi:competence protein ComEA
MKSIRVWIRRFFAFSRSETNAFLILLPLMLVIVFSEPAYRYWFTHQPKDFSSDSLRLDSMITTLKWSDPESSLPVTKLFHFNPNTATKEELVSLGFSGAMASRMINYRSMGGNFKIKSDVMKMYGADTSLYAKLYPYINLPVTIEKNQTSFSESNGNEYKAEREKLDINEVDSSELVKVYGIGGRLSARIIKYRNRLGGFISMDQLKEVYGLDSSVIVNLNRKFLIRSDYHPKQISINHASEKELGSHPYLSNKLARAIAAYRFQHGNFTAVSDIVKIQLIKEEDFIKIKPYLNINP